MRIKFLSILVLLFFCFANNVFAKPVNNKKKQLKSQKIKVEQVSSQATNTPISVINSLSLLSFCPADMNHDNNLSASDFDAFRVAFENAQPSVDFDHNGLLNANDFAAFMNTYAVGCTRADNPSNDESYLYKNGQEIRVNVFTKPDGKQSFNIIRLSDNVLLRADSSGETFYLDHSNGALQISYNIYEAPGGVNVVYHLYNPTNTPLDLPGFQIQGVNQDANNLKILPKEEWGVLTPVNTHPDSYPFLHLLGYAWPSDWVYSAVIVLQSESLAVGASIQYNYLAPQYRHDTNPTLFGVINTPVDNKVNWTIQFIYGRDHGHQQNGQLIPYPTIGAGQHSDYKVTLRFSNPRFWIYTLADYKAYLNWLYPVGNPHIKDQRPIWGVNLADPTFITSENSRGYTPWNVCTNVANITADCLRVDLHGFRDFVTSTMAAMDTYGYKRAMFWNLSGVYGGASANFNFPTQPVSQWLPALLNSSRELNRFNASGKEFGVWWGHAGSIAEPTSDTWNPSGLHPASLDNVNDHNFLSREFTLMKDYGASLMGGDAIVEMNNYQRYHWIEEMKQIAPNMNLISEVGGADFHRNMTNYYTNWAGQYVGGPFILAWYLNPQQELLLAPMGMNVDFNLVQQYTKWGYTFVGLVWPFVDVKNLDYHRPSCMVNSNPDRLWPRNAQCNSLMDDSD